MEWLELIGWAWRLGVFALVALACYFGLRGWLSEKPWRKQPTGHERIAAMIRDAHADRLEGYTDDAAAAGREIWRPDPAKVREQSQASPLP